MSLDLRSLPQHQTGLGPWSADHVVRLVLANVIAVVLVFVAWYEVSAQSSIRDQIPWMNLGIGGLVVAGATNALWLLQGRQAVGRASRHVLAPLAPSGRSGPAAAQARTRTVGQLVPAEVTVAGAGLHHFHREGCPLMSGKVADLGSPGAHLAVGLVPCEVCEP